MSEAARIGEIIKTSVLPHQQDSEVQNQTGTDKKVVYVTPSEARSAGIPFKHQPPDNSICQFCGKVLEPKGILLSGSVLLWQPFPPRCECREAQRYWAEMDQKAKEAEDREKEAERQRRMRDRVARLLGESGIKKRFQQRTFENFRCDTKGRAASYKIAKAYADGWKMHYANGDGLYIEGTNGTGKTHLAAAIALQLIGQGVPVICKTSSDLLMDIKRSYDSEDVSEAQVLDVYKRVDLLIVDDLGKEQCSDWSMSTLYSIFNDRYEDMKPTIITTNYSADDLIRALTPKGYDDSKIVAIISRLRETSTVMTMAWQDIRGGKT